MGQADTLPPEPLEKPLFSDPPAPPQPRQARQDAYGHNHGASGVDSSDTRKRLADLYLSGRGVEFGALHFSQALPMWASVRYADMMSVEELRIAFPDLKKIQLPDIVTDLESMTGIDDASEDFIIANHVMEHVEDPLRALKSIGRVLRPSGVAFLALPDKRFTFDIDRPVTPLEHIIRDHAEGPDWSAAQHYEEWVRCVDRLTGEAHQRKSSHMFRERTNIHFHVWDYPAMMELFAYVSRLPEIGLEVELSTRNGIEVIWILKKTAKA